LVEACSKRVWPPHQFSIPRRRPHDRTRAARWRSACRWTLWKPQSRERWWSRKHEDSRPMLNEETLQESRIQAVDIPERILRRETRCNPQTKRRVSYRQARSISRVFWSVLCARAIATLQATVVTPDPPLEPVKTSNFPPSGSRAFSWSVFAVRTRASDAAL